MSLSLSKGFLFINVGDVFKLRAHGVMNSSRKTIAGNSDTMSALAAHVKYANACVVLSVWVETFVGEPSCEHRTSRNLGGFSDSYEIDHYYRCYDNYYYGSCKI